MFGTLLAITNELAGPDTPRSCAEMISRTSPSTRETPVAALKRAADTERLRAPSAGASTGLPMPR